MRKLFGGAVALGLAAAGSLAVAGPGFAQEEPDPELDFTYLEATLSPTEANPGETVTVTPVDNCSASGGTLEWAVFDEGAYDWEDPTGGGGLQLIGSADLNEDGSWEVTFDPADFGTPVEEEGFSAATEEDPEEPEEPIGFEVYGPLGFSVGEDAYEWFGYCLEDFDVLEMEITSHEYDEEFGVYPTMAGDDVTVASIDPCPISEQGGDTGNYLISGEETEVTEGELELSDEGDWEITFKAPEAEGFYFVDAECFDGEGEFVGYYEYLVIANEVTGQPPVKPPTPATPIDEPPDETG